MWNWQYSWWHNQGYFLQDSESSFRATEDKLYSTFRRLSFTPDAPLKSAGFRNGPFLLTFIFVLPANEKKKITKTLAFPFNDPADSPTGLSVMTWWGWWWWHWSQCVYPDPFKHISALRNPPHPHPWSCFLTCAEALPTLPIDWSPFTRLPSSHFTRVCTSQWASG